MRVPIDVGLFAEIAEPRAALPHAEVLRVEVGGLGACHNALLDRFYVAVELRRVRPLDAVLPGPVLSDKGRCADAVHPIYLRAPAQRSAGEEQDVAVGGGSGSALV